MSRRIATVYQNYQTVCSVHVAKELLLDEGWTSKSPADGIKFLSLPKCICSQEYASSCLGKGLSVRQRSPISGTDYSGRDHITVEDCFWITRLVIKHSFSVSELQTVCSVHVANDPSQVVSVYYVRDIVDRYHRQNTDTIDHGILIKKLEHYGVRGSVLSLLTSYLQNRQQCVSVLGETSESLPVIYGVPQGSCLGPLLFLIYMNDLGKISKSCEIVLFADDTNIFV